MNSLKKKMFSDVELRPFWRLLGSSTPAMELDLCIVMLEKVSASLDPTNSRCYSI